MTAVGLPKQIHFLSGLPRSGSTLLAGLLAQNPRVKSGITSPVGGMFYALLNSMSAKHSFSVFLTAERRSRILRGIFDSYYFDQGEGDVVFDTNRMWCSKISALVELFPKAKFVCCVRDVAWIVDSFERVIRAKPLELGALSMFEAQGTIYSRVDGWMSGPMSMVGVPLNALKEAIFGEHAARILLLEYDALVSNPRRAMKELYAHIECEAFDHDPDNVVFSDGAEFDGRIGERGLHDVRRRVELTTRQTILPTDLFERLQRDNFWRAESVRNRTKIFD